MALFHSEHSGDKKGRSMTAKVKAMTSSEQYIPYFVAAAVVAIISLFVVVAAVISAVHRVQV